MSSIPSPRAFQSQASAPQYDGGDYVIINGRRVSCGRGMYGRDLSSHFPSTLGRRVVKVMGGHVQKIDPDRFYGPDDLKDHAGRPVKIKTMPERTKGGFFDSIWNRGTPSQPTADRARIVSPVPSSPRIVRPAPSSTRGIFDGARSPESMQLITEQVIDVARNYCKSPVSFDEQGGNWVVFPQFRLPPNWSQPITPLMIMFPREYPALPPIGFYLPDTLTSPHGHKFARTYHDASTAPLKAGWHWYCCTVAPGAWQPAADWRRGDNLWTYLTLIHEVLGSDD